MTEAMDCSLALQTVQVASQELQVCLAVVARYMVLEAKRHRVLKALQQAEGRFKTGSPRLGLSAREDLPSCEADTTYSLKFKQPAEFEQARPL